MTVRAIVDAQRLRHVFGAFPSGVTAIAATIDNHPVGMAASSFTSVSFDPPLVSLCVAHSSTTWPRLKVASRFGLSVLAAGQDEACRQLSARGADRFVGLEWRATAEGAVVLGGASAWLVCSVYAEHRAGDHDIIVLRVHDLDADHEIGPLIFHTSRFRRLQP